ncbi:MAG TPA: hypothetical protein VJO35_05980 [Terriglobales bacterium]|nr:hypothetical protein [Terriglobales bacterium]
MNLLFFSRGKGRGHAVPDSAIAEELQRVYPTLSITFVSYNVGAEILKHRGWRVIDLGLAEDNPFWDVLTKILSVFLLEQPDLVVSHEEFSVVPIAKAFGRPVIFMTDWLIDPKAINMQALEFADQIIFLDDPGFYDISEDLARKIAYVGPMLGVSKTHNGETRTEARCKLKIPIDAKVVLVAPGGAAQHSEARAPIARLMLDAYDLLDLQNKCLMWVADDPDFELLNSMSKERSDILIMKPHLNFASTMIAADLVITKANRISVLEAQSLGIPSISISFGNNPVDDYRVSRIRSNLALRGRGLDKRILARYMTTRLVDASSTYTDIGSATPALQIAQSMRPYLDGPQ